MCLNLLKESPPSDIYCFQEFWFEEDYYTLFLSQFDSSTFVVIPAKRMVGQVLRGDSKI